MDTPGRMLNCLAKLQDQLERMAQLQSESVLTVSKLSNAMLQISCEVSDIKSRLTVLETSHQQLQLQYQQPKQPRGRWDLNLQGAVVPENPSLTPAINPASLASDALSDMLALTARPARVLVVEDDVAYQWLVSKHLEARGIECALANTAQEALAKLAQPLGSGRFDLILMDIQLPGGASGLEITQRIRSFDLHTPIVSMTSSITPRQIASYLAGGMNDVLPKPFSKDGLLSLVCRFCKLSLEPKAGGKGPIEEIFPDDLLNSSFSSCSTRGGISGNEIVPARKTFVFTPSI